MKDLRAFLFSLGAPLGFDEIFNGSKFLQDKFISSLELPTYKDFRFYQFLDVLDALSYRMMIIDHLNKLESDFKKENVENVRVNGKKLTDNQQIVTKLNKEGIREVEIDIYKLIYQKKSLNILSFKELWKKEQFN